jgi:hypothetical protein
VSFQTLGDPAGVEEQDDDEDCKDNDRKAENPDEKVVRHFDGVHAFFPLTAPTIIRGRVPDSGFILPPKVGFVKAPARPAKERSRMLTKQKIAELEPKLAAAGITDERIELLALVTDKIQSATHNSAKPDAALQAAAMLLIAGNGKTK